MPVSEKQTIKRFLSLGGGVQSFTLALLVKEGLVPPVDAAIFADTQWEPYWVYEQIEWLKSIVPFPIFNVTAGNLREDLVNSYQTGDRCSSIPAFTPDGIGRRQCTNEYKIVPINRKKRELLGLKKGEKSKGLMCETLIGISLDECQRMRDSVEKWNKNTYPLIDLGMSRNDCLTWLKKNNYPIPRKSSCIGCPFHSNSEWRQIKDDPDLWADACEIDHLIRDGSIRNLKLPQYLHSDRIPLSEVDLSTPEERGQLNLFENECFGMCGV